MNETPKSTQRFLLIASVVAIVLVVAFGVGYWVFVRDGDQKPAPEKEVVGEEVVSEFYTSLAALDVGSNQLAAAQLKKAVAAEPREPALWANLAVTEMRLRQMQPAQEALNKAQALAADSREVALLQAEVHEHSGEIEKAIEQLRKVHQIWPKNIAATYSLTQLLGQVQSGAAEEERLDLLSDVLKYAPENLRVRAEQARLAATLKQGDVLRKSLDSLLDDRDQWPELARQKLADADQAAQGGDFRKAALSLTFFENVLKPTPAYQESIAALGIGDAGEIGTPLRSFLRLEFPPAQVADADLKLAFDLKETSEKAARPDLVLAVEQSGKRSSTLLSLSGNSLHTKSSAALPFPGSTTNADSASIAALDLNFDFREDLVLVGEKGLRIFLGQEDGSFAPKQPELKEFDQSWRAVWAVDVEADGDLDLLLSDDRSPLRWIRNNGDLTFTAMDSFIPAKNVRDLRAVDLDGDGDIDLVTLDAAGAISIWRNDRGGNFTGSALEHEQPRLAIALGDADRDGQFDLVSLTKSGELRLATWADEGQWKESPLTTWPQKSLANAKPGEVFLAVADVDNNGGVDVIAGVKNETGIWLRGSDGSWSKLGGSPQLRVTSIGDVNGDGLLDLVGMSENAGVTAVNQSPADYGWLVIEPKANTGAGDRRINSFGIGGRIEIRAGNLVEAAAIQSPRVHFGLGRHKQADVARFVWPNGVFQAEFDLKTGEATVATQRLKGSCPWVFAFDGEKFRFIKDFIWRSPLGLRINAQATAGVAQTEDWIKIPGGRLAAKAGRYPVRITAELWETHFFDHVSLLAVDHPADVEVYVDERFVPNESPAQKVVATTKPQPLLNVSDHRGNKLDEKLQAVDGRYVDSFALGEYQGVAEEHWVEFEIPSQVSAERPVLIVGHGWIYPTDSSINVAISQGGTAKPYGLVLEQKNPAGVWEPLRDNLGFPAGKNKDVVIELPPQSLGVSRRFRLRTNMEVYWDFLGWSYQVEDTEPIITKLPTHTAELRQRGYSKLRPTDRLRPDTPIYEARASGQLWADLEGFYTRFGDVRELLANVDDRYVIMNAGDELAFEFEKQTDPPAGWTRDFVLVGDGWVKDGDFNTAFSQWVRPLPAHDQKDYAGPLLPLAEDPVYRKHPEDWQTYHTRYITPRRFQQTLWRANGRTLTGETKR